MKSEYILFLLLLLAQTSCAQVPADRPYVSDPDFDHKISKTISFSVPLMGCNELKRVTETVVLFDVRERGEYDTSHIENARYLGYDDFDIRRLEHIPKDTTIVLYCSIGYRSEKMGERLVKMGYTRVYNLYGSIFEWVNQGNPVVDQEGKVTRKVHTYNRWWSWWLDADKGERVW